MIAITGHRSAIVRALLPLLPADETVTNFPADHTVLDADRYLFCAGVLTGKRLMEQTREEASLAFRINFEFVARACEYILSRNGRARICIVGSESGITGSYDAAYAGSKAAIHNFVETKRLPAPGQQLVCISPGIIEDAGMTLRRNDILALEARRQDHPKKRFLRSAEVASLIHYVLYVDRGYLSGVVIRMNGGAKS